VRTGRREHAPRAERGGPVPAGGERDGRLTSLLEADCTIMLPLVRWENGVLGLKRGRWGAVVGVTVRSADGCV